ncbi:MAG TPA: restriction endonuclease subunit S [Vicinamibacterales bacterium]|nr:restriction endonuclease subunit S [Vicinamibacterales bacterium]
MTGLPNGWTRRTIGSVCELVNGRAFKPTDWTSTGLPIVRIQNLNDPRAPFNRFDGEVRSRFLIDSGVLLFAWSGTPGTSFGAHIWNGGPAILNQHIFNVVFDEAVADKHFLQLAINRKLDELIDKAHGGVGLRHVTKGIVEETEIDFPPLEEQRQIVTAIHRLFAYTSTSRSELSRIPRLIERYKTAVLAKAFRGDFTVDYRSKNADQPVEIPSTVPTGRRRTTTIDEGQAFEPPYDLPESWRWISLPRLGALDRGRSRNRPRNAPGLYGGPYPFVQTGDIKASLGRLTTFTQTYSEAGLAQSRLWPKGTLCITIAANIAETAILGIDACFPDSVVGLIADERMCNPLFVEFFIRTVKADLTAFAPATAQKNINLETLRVLRVPLPPLMEQNEIVDRIDKAFTRIDRTALEAARAAALLDRLEQATLDKAFGGELTVASGPGHRHSATDPTPSIWVFGYGSLMWDGWENSFGGQRVDGASLTGYRRAFNKKSVKNWGSSKAPGPTLGLEPAERASCVGTAFEFPVAHAEAVKELLTGREDKSFSLHQLPVRLPDGREVLALTPVNDREHSTYIGNVSLGTRAEMARTARGTSGACIDYVRNIQKKLAELNIVDPDVIEFLSLVEQPVADGPAKKAV